jgi:undecaprenyl-diphosphatase
VPSEIVEWDARARASLASLVEAGGPAWTFLKNVTDTPVAMIGFASLLLMAWVWLAWKAGQAVFKIVRVAVVYLAFLGLSDLIAYRLLKKNIGRLKPHVASYVEGISQPLSFPSNHAFNLAFACTLAWGVCSSELRSRHGRIFIAFAGLVLVVGVSRVLVGEHYPLDVLGGWAFGALFAWISRPIFRFLAGLS